MSALTPPLTLLAGDARAVLATLPPACVQCVVTSPPFYAKRDYGTEPQVWGATVLGCEHEWQDRRYYTESAAAQSSAEAFSAPGATNAARIKAARWRHDATCARCGAWCGQLGQEPTPDLYVAHLVDVFRAVKRILRDDGVLFLNLGDTFSSTSSYNAPRSSHTAAGWKQAGTGPNAGRVRGVREKNLLLIPARVALALQADGWILRNELIWAKAAPMPESMTDRWTCAHEQIFLFSKRARYFCDMTAVREGNTPGTVTRLQSGPVHAIGDAAKAALTRGDHGPAYAEATGRNPRDVWALGPEAFGGDHYATFPSEIPRRAILAGTSAHGACAVCGAPWRRVVERERAGQSISNARHAQRDPTLPHGLRLDPTRRLGPDIADVTVTTGWAPTCKHADAAVVPCVTLDPFAGSGTTGAVARSLGRDAVLIELQPAYLPLIEARLAAVTPWWEAARPRPAPDDLGPLFRGVPA